MAHMQIRTPHQQDDNLNAAARRPKGPHPPEDLGAFSHSALLALSYQMDGRSRLPPPACRQAGRQAGSRRQAGTHRNERLYNAARQVQQPAEDSTHLLVRREQRAKGELQLPLHPRHRQRHRLALCRHHAVPDPTPEGRLVGLHT